MKKFYLNLAVLMTCLVALVSFASCDKDDDPKDSSKSSSIVGTWNATVKYFY